MQEAFGRKLIIAIVTTLTSSLIASIVFYTPGIKQDLDVGYVSFLGHFILFVIMIAPVVFTAGIILSMIVERKVKGISKTGLSYLVGGVILGFIYYLIYSYRLDLNILTDGIILSAILGGLIALLFLAVQIAFEPLFKKLKMN